MCSYVAGFPNQTFERNVFLNPVCPFHCEFLEAQGEYWSQEREVRGSHCRPGTGAETVWVGQTHLLSCLKE